MHGPHEASLPCILSLPSDLWEERSGEGLREAVTKEEGEEKVAEIEAIWNSHSP